MAEHLRHQYEEDEEPDDLVQASFTIQVQSPQAHQLKDDPGLIRQFPLLENYEATDEPAKLRQVSFEDAVWTIDFALESTCKDLFEKLFQNLSNFIHRSSDRVAQPYIPGFSSSKEGERCLPAAAIIGPQYSSQFRDKLKESLALSEETYWVELESRECSSLAATLQLVTSRISSQATGRIKGTSFDLSSLTSLPSSSTIILYLPSLARNGYALLNDLIKSLHASFQSSDLPRLVVLFGSEGGSSPLEEKLDHESMRLLELQRFYTPLPAEAFEGFMQQFFLARKVDSSRLWPGPALLEYIQHQFFDRGFNLDRLASTMKLAFHHHFTVRPLSSLINLPEARPLGEEHWHPPFFLRARSQYVHQARDGVMTVDDCRHDFQSPEKLTRSFEALLTEDLLVLGHACHDLAEIWVVRREELKAAIHILHNLQSHLLMPGSRTDPAKLNRGPRTSTLGGLTFEAMSGFDMSKFITRVTTELRNASFETISSSLESITEGEWNKDDKIFSAALASHQAKVRELITASEGAEGEADDAGKSTKEHGKRVQKRWLQLQQAEAIKKEIADWLGSILNKWIANRPPVPAICTYDFTSYITQLTDPSTRSQMIAALNDPHLILQSAKSTRPDISRLYEMYQSAGRMINLADWYEAFAQSIKAEHKGLGKRQREQVDSEEDIQAHFALSLNEMGKMGFLKKTRRKADHVLKVVHDLPPREI